MKNRFPRKGWLFLVALFGILAVAYLSSFIFHQGADIKLIDLIPPDADNPDKSLLKTSICADRFCSVTCDPGFAAFSGRCSSSGGWQWNLNGISSNFKSWYCFDSSLLNVANIQGNGYPIVTAEAMCVKVGNNLPPTPPPKLGNYLVEGTEICDMNNTDGFDCTAFTARKWDEDTGTIIDVPLCNGYLTCNAAGTKFDISHCQYCNGNNDPNGIEVGNNNQCNPGSFCECFPYDPLTCPVSNNDPVCGNGFKEAGEECEPPNQGFITPLGAFFCTGTCKVVGAVVPSDTCGDSVVQDGEECDPPGTTALTGSSALCMFGGYCVYETATCQADCTWKKSWPNCPGPPVLPPDGSSNPGGGSCYSTGLSTIPGEI